MRGGVLALVLMAAGNVSADDRVDYSFHAGFSWSTTEANFNPTPGGFAPYLDASIALRSKYVSFGPFGAFSSLAVQSWGTDQSTLTTVTARYSIFDIGLGIDFHGDDHDGPFAGIGVAMEATHESGRESVCICTNFSCDSCPIQYSNEPHVYTRWVEEPLLMFHVGYTLPPIENIPLELIGVVAFGYNPDEPAIGPELFTTRFAVGARF